MTESSEHLRALSDLLVSCFGADELRIFITLLGKQGASIAAELPVGVSLASLAVEVAIKISQYGLASDIFVRLIDRFPYRSAEIEAVASAWAPEILRGSGSASRLRALTARLPWWRDAIPLRMAVGDGDRQGDARAELQAWLHSPGREHCVLCGDAGAGKTGLMLWLALELTSHDRPALLVPAARLRGLKEVDLEALFRHSEPPVDPRLARIASIAENLHLLIDGLDELIGSVLGGDALAVQILERVLQVVPVTARVVVSCRSPVYDRFERVLRRFLPRPSQGCPELFRADSAIDAAFDGEASVARMTVLPLTPAVARAYLDAAGIPTAALRAPEHQGVLGPFLARPLTVRMLAAALPGLRPGEELAIDELYDRAVSAILLRESPGATKAELEQLKAALQDVARTGKLPQDRYSLHILERAQMVSFGVSGTSFAHYSLWEYFFARSIHEQLMAFDSKLLSRVDLISGYNLNRLLVPMLLRTIGQGAAANAQIEPVSVVAYEAFVGATGWRLASGHGVHPSITGSVIDGLPAATFPVAAGLFVRPPDPPADSAVSDISWYDAMMFARFSRRRLPTSKEIATLPGDGDLMYWCSDWYDESRAYMSVFDAATGKVEGCNPDLRLPKIALVVR